MKGVTKEATSAQRKPGSPGKPLIHSLCSPHASHGCAVQAQHWREGEKRRTNGMGMVQENFNRIRQGGNVPPYYNLSPCTCLIN